MNNDAINALEAFGLSKGDTPIYTSPSTGQFVAFKFDLLKPGRYYYDLSAYETAMQGENGYRTPVMFLMNGVPLTIDDNTVITIIGNNPAVTNSEFTIVPSVANAGGPLTNIDWPSNVFQVTGKYVFHIEVKQNGRVYKTAQCVLDVQPNMICAATDFKNGISPYDSTFEAWRAKIQQQLTDIDNQIASNAKLQQSTADLTKQISNNVNDIVNGALSDVPKLDQNNTFKGNNNFGNVNADAATITNGNFTNLAATSLSADTLSLNKSLILKGEDITKGLITNVQYLVGSLINGVTWNYTNIYLMKFAGITVAILASVINIPNNSTFQNASEHNTVPTIQFPKGTLKNVGGTYITLSGAQFQIDTANDTLNFCGLVNTTWDNWGRAIRDTAVII